MDTEVVIDVRKGLPVLRAKIGGKNYNFIIAPSENDIFLSPELVSKFNLAENARKVPYLITLDHATYQPLKTNLEI